MKIKPVFVRHLDSRSVEKLESKLRALEKVITTNRLGDFPKRVSATNFARWENGELGAFPLPRTWIYHSDCLSLQQRLVHLLAQLKQQRAQRTKKASTESDLRQQLKRAEDRAQDYVNQYTETRAELVKARAEIDRLNQKLQRCLAHASKITPLRLVPSRNKRKAQSQPVKQPRKK